MRIAIEGADCTGKSTLVNKLVTRGLASDNTKHWEGTPTEDDYRAYENYTDIIFDRFVLGDMVYNKPRMLSEEFIVEQLKSLDALYLVCPPRDVHRARCIERGEEDDFYKFDSDSDKFRLVTEYLLIKYYDELKDLEVHYIGN